MRLQKILLIIFAATMPVLMSLSISDCGGSGGDKPAPKPPDKFSLTLRQDLLFTRPTGSAWLTATAPSSVSYNAPSSPNNCNLTTPAQHTWVLESNADYIDLTMNQTDGIPPGIGNARAYVLTHQTPDESSYDFIMRQGTPATDYLYVETWRLGLNAIENPANEIGNGGPYAPPLGQLPFPRSFKLPGQTVGGQWILSPGGGASIAGLTVRLTFSITNSVPGGVCP